MDRGWGTGDRSYIAESRLVRLKLGRDGGWGTVSGEAAGTAKTGKCFHTGNMGFPLGKDAKDKDWLKRRRNLECVESGFPRAGMFRNAAMG
jgi:hypothetical protein